MAYTFLTSELPKVVREWCALYILTWKCASCHNGVRFFDISSSKSGPNLVCFVHFDLEMCLTACNFSSLIWPAGSAPAALASQPSEKHSESRLSYLFCAPASSFFSLFLFPDLLASFLLLSDSTHLCFSIFPYCRKFDS